MRTLAATIAFSISVALATPHTTNAFCFNEAAERYGVAPELLIAISSEESGMRSDTPPNWNTDGSYDIGLMRINSNWYFWSKTVRDLWPNLEDPCTNVMVGAWILAGCVKKYGYNWKAVGCYHSQTPNKRDSYAKRIAKRVFGLQAGSATTGQLAGIDTHVTARP